MGRALLRPGVFVWSFFFALSAHALNYQETKQRLVLCGGGTIPKEALTRFSQWSGEEHARILVITWAAEEPDPKDYYQSLYDRLQPVTKGTIKESIPLAKAHSLVKEVIEEIKWATGIWFTGGDQNYVMDYMAAHPEVLETVIGQYLNGVAIGGHSAGTALMSERMFTGTEPLDVLFPGAHKLRDGLGLIKGVIVDQHFLERGRANRLISGINPALHVGLGIDGGACAAVHNGETVELLGTGEVVQVSLLQPGRPVTLNR